MRVVSPFCVCLLATAVVVDAKLLRRKRRTRESPLDVVSLSMTSSLSQHQHQFVLEVPGEDGGPNVIDDELLEDLITRYLQTDGGLSLSMSMSMPVAPEPSPTPAPVVTEPPVPTEAPPPTTPAPVPSPTTPAPVDVTTPSPTTEAPVETPTTPSPVEIPATPAPSFSNERDEEIKDKCGVTPLERSRDILTILSDISDGASLITLGTPEFEARQWLDMEDDAVICADSEARIEQRYRVAVLYYALGGPDWTNCKAEEDADEEDVCIVDDIRQREPSRQQSNFEEFSIRFLSEANECEWYGLSCATFDGDTPPETDPYFPLTSIEIALNNLEGQLPTEIFGLLELTRLNFYENMIYGTIPEELGNLGMLGTLSLDENVISGTIPEGLYELTKLGAIDLHANLLTGPISPAVGNLVDLLVLQLEFNQLSGEIPSDELLKLTRLGTCATFLFERCLV